jgi:thioredoxin 1
LTLGAVIPYMLRPVPQENTMSTTAVTDSSFEADVLRAPGPVLVDFWAEWCAPCKAIAPTLEEIAVDLQGKLTIAKLNIDENPRAPMKYGIHGIPTLLLFKNGQVAATRSGQLPKSKLLEWIKSVL